MKRGATKDEKKNRAENKLLINTTTDESSASNADVPVIPSELKVTHQILIHWEPFRDLKSRFLVTVEMRSGLLTSDRHSFLPLWTSRSQ